MLEFPEVPTGSAVPAEAEIAIPEAEQSSGESRSIYGFSASDFAQAQSVIEEVYEELNRQPADPAGDLVAREMALRLLYNYRQKALSQGRTPNL